MKKYIVFIFIFGLITHPVLSQKKQEDRFKFSYDISMGVLPLQITGISEQGVEAYSIIDSHSVPIDPEYEIVTVSGLVINEIVHLGIHLPLYKTSSWSIGTKLNAGAGLQLGVISAEGLHSFIFDFPQFLYYQKYGKGLNYSILLGYKHTIAALNYGLPVAGFEVNFSEKKSLRLYGSLQRYKYYSYYTDGRIEPFIQIGEYGLGYILKF